MLWMLFLIAAECSAALYLPTPYDPVWLASVQAFPPVGLNITPVGLNTTRWAGLNETRWAWPNVRDEDVQFRLFTKRSPYSYQLIHTGNASSLWSSGFNRTNKVKILSHGWLNHGYSPMPEGVKEAYLNVTDINIIVVDWSVAANVNYITASYNVAQVGHLLTKFLDFLVAEGISMDDVHLIGHSLGAHVVGIAGAYVENATIDTITGLDPAWPLFMLARPNSRLDKHDAKHVEVIHTCGGYLGFPTPLGHVDFYPNGGRNQPGCISDYRGFCSHNRAHLFFAEAIISPIPFTAVQCDGYDELFWNGRCKGTGHTLAMGGLEIHYGKEGVYYLETNAESPFVIDTSENNI